MAQTIPTDNTELLRTFLIEANRATYASGRQATVNPDGSKELAYERGPWAYADRYFGFDPFIGQEVVRYEGRVIWGMNYYGRVLASEPAASEIYGFLQRAMREVTETRPYRGPASYTDGDLTYSDDGNGDLDAFTGAETIAHRGPEATREVYRLDYHGGRVAG